MKQLIAVIVLVYVVGIAGAVAGCKKSGTELPEQWVGIPRGAKCSRVHQQPWTCVAGGRVYTCLDSIEHEIRNGERYYWSQMTCGLKVASDDIRAEGGE